MRKTQSEFATVLLRKAFQNGFVKGMAINLVGQCLAQNDKEMYTEHEQETMFGSFLKMLDNHPANQMCASIQQPDPEKAIAKGMRVIVADPKLAQRVQDLRAQVAKNAELLKRLEPSAPKPTERVIWPADLNEVR